MSAPQKSPQDPTPQPVQKPKLRRYFFDTEFRDEPEKFRCELVSIGILNEKGREYYGISNEFNLKAAKEQPWLKTHVIDKLDDPATWKSVAEIRQGVLDMFEPAQKVELWARNGSHDNVLICQLFGGMGEFFDLLKKEKNIDRVEFRDINELKRSAGKNRFKMPRLPDAEAHIAINDARNELQCYKFLKNLKKKPAETPEKPAEQPRRPGKGAFKP